MQAISKRTIIVLSLLVASALSIHFYVRYRGLAIRSQIDVSGKSPDEMKRLQTEYNEKMIQFELEKKKKADEARKAQEAADTANNSQFAASFKEKQKLDELAKSLVITASPGGDVGVKSPTSNPQPTEESAPQEIPSTYTAAGGESLRAIAQQLYGDRSNWQKIWRLNLKVTNTENIPAGTVLRLPSREAMAEKDAPPPPVAIEPYAPSHQRTAVGYVGGGPAPASATEATPVPAEPPQAEQIK